jgi:hypothetical protein
MIKFKSTLNQTDKSLSKKYPEFYSDMIKFVKEDNISLSEKIWLFQNEMEIAPSCLNCENRVKFIKFSKGYNKFCSKKCSAIYSHKNLEIKNKRITKMIECNYNKELKKEMTKKSNSTKSNFTDEKKNEINLKRIQTNIKKYGVVNISQLESVKLDVKEKLSKIIPNLRKEKTIKRVEDIGYKFIGMDRENISLYCNTCSENSTMHKTLFNQRSRFGITCCINCNPIGGSSDFQRMVSNFIKINSEYEILESYRGFKDYEIDIFIPHLKIGFECNGLWWHSEIYRSKNYHINKREFFEEKGIKIINIWEDEWKFKKDIVESRILSKIGLIRERVYARKCKILPVNSKDLKIFLDKNHIQGHCYSKINIGLFYNNELVSVGTFGQLRKNLGQKSTLGNYEMIRFCNKLNTNVIGGFSKILKFFINEYKPKRLISYCDKSYNTGESYKSQGFSLEKETEVNYWYFHKDIGVRINRWNFRKDKLVKEGFDKNKTEIEIMKSRGYFRIFDCGSYLFSKNF